VTPVPEAETRYCSACGHPWPASELARFGDQLVCAACKPAFTQRLREGVPAQSGRRYAGFWMRVGAAIIDAIILFIIQFAMQTAFSPVLARRDPMEAIGVLGVVSVLGLLMGAAYEGVLVSRYAATPGKMALGLQVTRPDGSLLSLGRSIGRHS
jgi:RDD family